MSVVKSDRASELAHNHTFLAADHEHSERRTRWVIALCGVMMALEIAGGMAFGSIALVAEGLHMSTHVLVLLITALAYRFARTHADQPRFAFGTGKFGDLAGFASALVLALIAIGIGWDAVSRLFAPVPIRFTDAIPIAVLGLVVNIASALILSGGHLDDHHHASHAHVMRDNNMRAAIVHIAGDAAVSVLVIGALVCARTFGWLWMDPLAGIVGAVVIAAWAYGLMRDTGRILLDMTADRGLAETLRARIEADGDELTDLHLWRLGPGHLGAILCVCTPHTRDAAYYRARLAEFESLSHLTIEVHAR